MLVCSSRFAQRFIDYPTLTMKIKCLVRLSAFVLAWLNLTSLAAANTSSRFQAMIDELKEELTSKVLEAKKTGKAEQLLLNAELDEKLAQFVVLSEATPEGLASFIEKNEEHLGIVESLLENGPLLVEMLVADGAKAPRQGRSFGAAQYGEAALTYSKITKASRKASTGILRNLALAISLEHAVPVAQRNPEAQINGPEYIDPVRRYLHYEKAFEAGELDPAFSKLSVWDLRMVVDGEEPDETLAWGREMLRNFRPDHLANQNHGWRYVGLVTSDVKYGSQDVKYDRPELQFYQNILMNGGVCGRRAFIGRFILRAFGVPTVARPSRGHGALAHWTPEGWVVNLGGGWGAGWTNTKYHKDLNFLATTQARSNPDAFLQVKRAQWIGDLFAENRIYGDDQGESGFWNQLALAKQKEIIEHAQSETLAALGEELGEADRPASTQSIKELESNVEKGEITIAANGAVLLPASTFVKPKANTRDVVQMASHGGGTQVFLPRFFPKGTTILRGGTWKGDATACSSGSRMLSGGYGRYENWGLRAAMTPSDGRTPREITLDLGNGVEMEMVYIKPGKFVMGGERETDGRFECVEVPKHPVELSQGFYLGKYEVTQAQYQQMMGTNPSRSTKDPQCPVDNVGVDDAKTFCMKVALHSGAEVRLPTEAEWEYASRGGQETKWFFGDRASDLGSYAWFKGNAGGKSHPVGQKKANPYGLFDIYGNVNERVSDTYARDYYAKSPQIDPTGPSQGVTSQMEYEFHVPHAGNYVLSAEIVTVNYDQRINVTVNDHEEVATLSLPFTNGSWGESESILIELKQGKNHLRLFRDFPPQYGVALKAFTLKPVR